MNSQQRRQFDRKTKHQITMYASKFERYFQFDDEVIKAKTWCKRKCKGSYMCASTYDKATFKFEREGDAVIFALKWL